MALPAEVIETLIQFLDDSSKILHKHLRELLQNQKSFNINDEIFLIPSEVIRDPRYLKALDRNSVNFSKTILGLLDEWQTISSYNKNNHTIENFGKSNVLSNFNLDTGTPFLNENTKKHRLLILLSPLKVSPSCIHELKENLEIELIEDLKIFLNINYPISSEECPIEFRDDYFYHSVSNIDIQKLQMNLAHIPTLTLHSSISDYKAYFYIGFWLPYSNHILNCTLPTCYWEELYDILVSSGKKEREALRIIRQIIISIQELLSAFIADWYYLHLNPDYMPRLLSPKKILTSRYFDLQLIEPYLEIIKETQNRQRNATESLKILLSNQQNDVNKKIKQKIKKWSLNIAFTSHSGCVHALAFNGEHSNLISGGSDSLVRLWNPSTGKAILNLKGHVGDIFAIAISNNDRYLASGGSDCKVLVWSLDKLQEPISLHGHTAYVSSLAFTPDNRFLASGSYDNSIRIWDLWTNKTFRIFNEHSSYVTALSFNKTGDLLASGSHDCAIKLWHPWQNKLQNKAHTTLTGHSDAITCAAFSPNNDLLASGSRDCTIKLWKPETGTIISTLKGHTAGITSLAFSPNGEILVSGGIDHTIRLWNPKTAEEIGILAATMNPILCVTFSKDGYQLAAGSCWSDNIKVWNCS